MLDDELLQNRETLFAAARHVQWKTELALNFFKKKNAGYDHRNYYDLAPMLIDVSDLPEDQREAAYIEELKKMDEAFNTPGAVKPYIERMYKSTAINENIDWSNQREVEKILCTIKINQGLSTMAVDFKAETMELYRTQKEVAELDAIVAKSFLLYFLVGSAIYRNGFAPELEQLVPMGLQKNPAIASPFSRLLHENGAAICDATLKEKNIVTLDPMKNDYAKKMFFDESFDVYDEKGEWWGSQDDYKRTFFESIANSYSYNSIEQLLIKTVKDNSEIDFDDRDLLAINGKPMSAIAQEIMKKKGVTLGRANAEADQMLQKALKDGKSLVSVMRVAYTQDGKTRFFHQEINVDLDKMNEVDRKETKYSAFRRFLDKINVWKIQRFPKNEERDARQAKMREKPAYKAALRAMEDKLISAYHSIDKTRRGEKDLVRVIPQLSRAEELGKQTDAPTVDNAPVRWPITDVVLDQPVPNTAMEPKKDDMQKVIEKPTATK